MFNWFSKDKKVSVPDLEEIKLEPEIIIPEKTRRELYDLAVLEVQHKRVSKLILDNLNAIAIDPVATRQAEEAQEAYPSGIADGTSDRLEFHKRFPLVRLEYGCSRYHVVSPSPTLESLANVLATQYLGE